MNWNDFYALLASVVLIGLLIANRRSQHSKQKVSALKSHPDTFCIWSISRPQLSRLNTKSRELEAFYEQTWKLNDIERVD